MARTSRRAQAIALLALLVSFAHGQTLTNLPNLSTATELSSSSQAATATNTKGGTSSIFHITNLPTINGPVPNIIVPFTGNAPFMQKSALPEGTFFIAVGAGLAFLGACVLLWRAMVAWSINRSVKRSAMAAVGARSEKSGLSSTYGGWGGSRKSSGYNPVSKANFYKTSPDGNSVSMENLTSTGKPLKGHSYRDSTMSDRSKPPPDLFFSPTAQARESASGHRASGYMPSGYYATPNSQAAGGAVNPTRGASIAPYARQQHSRQSTQDGRMSPPVSPISPEPPSRGSAAGMRGPLSRDGTLNSRDGGLRAPPSYLYAQPSSSSLMVGQSSNGSDLTGPPSRAPSAYLEDLFENHGNGPRERF